MNRTLPMTPDFGKIPPQAVDVEKNLLGTCLVYPDVVHEIKLRPEMFYKEAHQKIFKTIQEVAAKGIYDISIITTKLRDSSELEMIGGPVYLTQLTSDVFTNQMVVPHSLIIKEKWLRREYIRISNEIQNRAFNESFDFSEVIDYTETSLFELSDFTQAQEPSSLEQCVDSLIDEVEQVYTKEKSLVGVPSGFTSIDRMTGGWQNGNLIIVAGRPSMGKTALALILAKNPARFGYPVSIFSLEMSKMELTTRFMSGPSGYSSVQIRNANINMERFVSASHEIASLPITIDDTPSISLLELRSKIKKQILKKGTKLVVIDYLQLMTSKAASREQEISSISRGLKAISKEFNIPIIALSQLNRGVEERADRVPRLSDLRESGAIEQDADIVCFVYRPAVYKIRTIMMDSEEISTEGIIVLDGAKNRNGALFTRALHHNETMSKIQEEEFETTNEFE